MKYIRISISVRKYILGFLVGMLFEYLLRVSFDIFPFIMLLLIVTQIVILEYSHGNKD